MVLICPYCNRRAPPRAQAGTVLALPGYPTLLGNSGTAGLTNQQRLARRNRAIRNWKKLTRKVIFLLWLRKHWNSVGLQLQTYGDIFKYVERKKGKLRHKLQ